MNTGTSPGAWRSRQSSLDPATSTRFGPTLGWAPIRVSPDRPATGLRDLSLNWNVALTVTAAVSGIMIIFLLVFVPFQRQQRTRLLSRDQRLLSVLREKYTRDLISDVLSENQHSLAADIADFARQPKILRVQRHSGPICRAA